LFAREIGALETKNGISLLLPRSFLPASLPAPPCNCYVEACDEIDVRELRKDSKNPIKETRPTTTTEKKQFGERTLEVPDGIDKGWAYTPGAGGMQGLLRSLAEGYPPLTEKAWKRVEKVAMKEVIKDFRKDAKVILDNIWDFRRGRKTWQPIFPESITMNQVEGQRPQ
jgi:hypothetical protein